MHVGSRPYPSLLVLGECKYGAWHIADVGYKVMIFIEHIYSVLVGAHPRASSAVYKSA